MLKSRLFFCDLSLLKNVNTKQKEKKVWSRSSTIVPLMLNKFYFVYNGKMFIKVKIDNLKMFTKLGVYSKTRTDFYFPVKTQVKKK